jgi:alpha-beta hydrolase superfamily lysophospholipase
MLLTPKPTSWLEDLLTSLAICSGVGYLATSYTVSRWLTRNTREKAPLPTWVEDCSWEQVACRTSDGLRLVGWVVTPRRVRGTVALFHGMRGNRSKTLGRMQFLLRAGYRCVAFDHRAHGQSEGQVTSFGYYEGRDVGAVVEFIRQQWPQQPRAALGISMGAAALCYATEHSRAFDAVILESMYHNLTAAFTNRVGCDFPHWFHPFIKGVIWITEKRLGLRMPQMAPVNYIHGLGPTPVLLLTGEQDPHATPEEVEAIYQNCREPREFRVIPQATHTDVCEKGGVAYQETILDFLQRRLPRRLAA